jgi:group I intron endonuclease
VNTVKWCEMNNFANGETIQDLNNGNTVLCRKTIGIYKITNKTNGKSYIGQSVDIKRRWAEHRMLSRDETLSLKRALKKYGVENFEFIVLEVCETDLLNRLEEHYIAFFNPEYNRTKGGDGSKGCYRSDETKAILREKSKLQWVNKSDAEKNLIILNNLKGPKKGHSVSNETKNKLSERNLGKKQSAETIQKRKDTFIKIGHTNWNYQNKEKPIFCVELNRQFESIKKASEILNINSSSICQQVKGKRKSVGSYKFSYVV